MLFFVWGDSIHARRRIRIFTEDPSFEVGVVSTFAYDFEHAENFYLSGSGRVDEGATGRSLLVRGVRALLSRLLFALLRHREEKITLHECRRLIADISLTRQYVKSFAPDLVFLQTLLYPCYLSLLLPRKIPSMITFWNGDVTWWAHWDGMERLLKKNIVTWGVRRARAVTVNSEAAFEACLGYGAAPGKIHLLRYPGVDMARFCPADKREARRRLGIAGEHVVLAPRGLGGYLNSDVILDAAALVAREIPEVVLLISCAVAEGDELEIHRRRATALGISANCRWIPKIAWEEMADFYRAADVMVSISSHDSLPNCMLEAMACGVPVIMGDIPQLKEWVRDGETGFVVPVRDPDILAQRMVALLQNRDGIADAPVRNALDMVAEYVDSRKTVPRIKDLVRNAAQAAKRE